ncbi:MAG: TolC family protein [Deltaproteobacteria bacterium]|jgi:outer membrane protein
MSEAKPPSSRPLLASRWALGALLAFTPAAPVYAQRGDEPAAVAARGAATSLDAYVSVPGGLRVAEVVRAVLDTSHDRAARLAELGAARAQIERTTLAFVPRVTLGVSYTRLSPIDAPRLGVLVAPADQTSSGLLAPSAPLLAVPVSFPVVLDQTQARAQLAIPVTDYFLRVLPARDAAEHAGEAAEAAVTIGEQALALEAEILYWSWARAELGILVAERALALAEAHRDDARRLVAAGLALASDVARAEAQVAAMQELAAVTSHARDAARDRMRTVTHSPGLSTAIGEPLLQPEQALDELEPAVELALHARSELGAIDAQLAALEAQRTLEDAAIAPRVDVFAEALLANPNPRFVPQTERFDVTWAVGAQASWQLTDALAAEPSRRALEGRIAALREHGELLREGIRAEVVDAHRALLDARSATESRRAQIAAAERALQLASEVYRNGRGTSLAVMDAQTLLVRAELDLLAARIDGRIARARLRRATEQASP